MLKRIIGSEKIEFNGSDFVEIFNKQKYKKNYYLRGQITRSFDQIRCNKKGQSILLWYDLKVLVLIHDDYIFPLKPLELDASSQRFPDFGLIIGRTKNEYNDFVKKYCSRITRESMEAMLKKFEKDLGGSSVKRSTEIKRKIAKQAKDRCKKSCSATYEYKKEEVELPGYEDIDKQIKKQKKIILCRIDMAFLKSTGKDKPHIKDYQTKLYDVLARNFSDNPMEESVNYVIESLIEKLYDTLASYFSYSGMNKPEYRELLKKIANLATERIKNSNGEISDIYLGKLNDFISKYEDYRKERMETYIKKDRVQYDPLKRFCCNFFDDLINDLVNKNLVTSCPVCEHVFKYKKNKLCCNLGEDGRDCQSKLKEQDLIAGEIVKKIFNKYKIETPISLIEVYHLMDELLNNKNKILKGIYWKRRKENPDIRIMKLLEIMADEFCISESYLRKKLQPLRSFKNQFKLK